MHVGHEEYFLCDTQICVSESNKKVCVCVCVVPIPKKAPTGVYIALSYPPGISMYHTYIKPTNTTLAHHLLVAVTDSGSSLNLTLAGMLAPQFCPPRTD